MTSHGSTRGLLSRPGRKVASVAGLLTIALALVACGSSSNSETASAESTGAASATEGAPATEAAAEPCTPSGTVTVWAHEEPASRAFLDKKYREYEKLYPDVKIESLYIPIGDLGTKLTAAYGAGNPPDIVKNGAWLMTSDIQKGNLAPVDESALGLPEGETLQSYFEPGALDPVSFDGQTYGIPTDFNSVSLWYRKDRFEEAGLDPNTPPTTWEEVVEFNEKLTSADGKKVGLQNTLYGDPIWAMLQMIPLLNGLGGSLLNADNTAGSLNTPEGIQALKYLGGTGNPKLSAPIGGFSMFADGTAAMLMGGRFMTGFMTSLNDKLVYGENFATTTIPFWEGKSPVASGYSWAWQVPAKADNQCAAWNLIGWLSSEENSAALLDEAGLVAPLKEWTTRFPAASDEPSKVMQSQLPYTNYGPQLAQWNEVMTLLSQTIDSVALGQATAEEAAANFDSKTAEILGG